LLEGQKREIMIKKKKLKERNFNDILTRRERETQRHLRDKVERRRRRRKKKETTSS